MVRGIGWADQAICILWQNVRNHAGRAKELQADQETRLPSSRAFHGSSRNRRDQKDPRFAAVS